MHARARAPGDFSMPHAAQRLAWAPARAQTRTWPTVARQLDGTTFLEPLGSLMRVMPASGLCATTMA